MHSKTLTQPEWNVLTYIQQHTQRWGNVPSVSDIRSHCRLTKKEANDILHSLEQAGLVRPISRIRNGHTVRLARLIASGTVVMMPTEVEEEA